MGASIVPTRVDVSTHLRDRRRRRRPLAARLVWRLIELATTRKPYILMCPHCGMGQREIYELTIFSLKR